MLVWGCGSRNDLGENAYLSCETADDCDAPDGLDPACLDKSGEGFCTLECTVDEDCVDAGEESEEEDEPTWTWVCSSFETATDQYCFPSCEDPEDPELECPEGFTCRSTGGGSNNRKVCFPEVLNNTSTP